MPNHHRNTARFTGTPEKLLAFAERLRARPLGPDGRVEFFEAVGPKMPQRISDYVATLEGPGIPMDTPDELNPIEWQRQIYGCKWTDWDTRVEWGESEIVIHFVTAWNQPDGLYDFVEKFYGLDVTAVSSDEGDGYQNVYGHRFCDDEIDEFLELSRRHEIEFSEVTP